MSSYVQSLGVSRSAAVVNVRQRLMPALKVLRDAISVKATESQNIVKIGRTHMQDLVYPTLSTDVSSHRQKKGKENAARINARSKNRAKVRHRACSLEAQGPRHIQSIWRCRGLRFSH
jgi:fumarate hydratase class II